MILLDDIEKKYNFIFPDIFKQLWNDGMLDWMNGRTMPFNKDENWAKTIYPEIKDNPPLLLHSGGFDFEMLRSEEILNFKFDELWDIEEHEFIPFAKTDENNVYAFYKNLKIDKEYVIVYIWNDMNETEIIAKNFEDFIFRKMLEAIFDIDKDDLKGDYRKSGFEGYKIDLLSDLKSITPYLNKSYIETLIYFYNREVQESVFSYGLISKKELVETIQKYLSFKELDSIFEHEIE
jgi:hypothetical protein